MPTTIGTRDGGLAGYTRGTPPKVPPTRPRSGGGRPQPYSFKARLTSFAFSNEPCGSGGNVRTINVGSGGLAIFNPSGALFLPTVLGLIFGLIAVGLALGKVKPAPAKLAAPPPAVPRLVPMNPLGTPYSMVANLVSFRDIPVGAPRQEDPRQQFTPGEPTDVTRPPPCPTCRGPMGFAAGGWFCLNPNCPLRQHEAPWPRLVHGIMHP